MSRIAILSKSNRKDKKWTVTLLNGGAGDEKTIHFGAEGYLDYTQHKDPNRRERYIQRHAVREDWNNPYTAGFWSRWLLWEKPTLKDAISYVKKKFKITITLK